MSSYLFWVAFWLIMIFVNVTQACDPNALPMDVFTNGVMFTMAIHWGAEAWVAHQKVTRKKTD